MWLLLATGARPADIFRLTFQQIIVGKEELTVSWWLRKAQRYRRERHEETYPYSWSCPPSTMVRKFLRDGPPTHGVLPVRPDLGQRRVAQTASAAIKREFPDLTSYVFRDRMESILEEAGTTERDVKLLLDHSGTTSRSSYQKSRVVLHKWLRCQY
jgi:integrase